jgi:hypothetical protein
MEVKLCQYANQSGYPVHNLKQKNASTNKGEAFFKVKEKLFKRDYVYRQSPGELVQ